MLLKKPEITAPSQGQWVPINGDTSWTEVGSTAGQTSWSVPHTGGVAAVLLSYANTTPETNDNQNEVIKAVIVNSAFPNIQNEYGTATTGQVWNKYRGYGRIDALRAYQTLSSPAISYNPEQSINTNVNQPTGWIYRTFSNNIQLTDIYRIYANRNDRLVLTMTWNRKIKSGLSGLTPATNPMNLDLEIFDPQGVPIFWEHLSDTDPPIPNNLRKADILCESKGYYKVQITNTVTKPNSRAYAMAFELLPPLEADFNTDYVVDNQDMIDFLPYWLSTDCNNIAQPCYDYNLNPNDDSIGLNDLAIFANQWMTYDPRYYSP